MVVAEVVPGRPEQAAYERFFAIALMLLLFLLVLVGVGVSLQQPGLGVAYVVVVLPPLIATRLRLRRRKAQQGRVTWAERFVTLVLSGLIMLTVLGAIAAAVVIALLAWCFVATSQHPR
jgi:hypothetical protein